MTQRLADPERELALSYASASRRAALRALWMLDERLGAIVAGTSDPTIGEMRLLWWREALTRPAGDAPAEPLLREIEARVRPLGIAGDEIGAMAEGWHALLLEPLECEQIERYARERGARLFALSARLLGGNGEDKQVIAAGALWALIDLARRVSDPAHRALAIALARETRREPAPRHWARKFRPLGALAVLARGDARKARLASRGSPARVARMLWMRLTGN